MVGGLDTSHWAKLFNMLLLFFADEETGVQECKGKRIMHLRLNIKFASKVPGSLICKGNVTGQVDLIFGNLKHLLLLQVYVLLVPTPQLLLYFLSFTANFIIVFLK